MELKLTTARALEYEERTGKDLVEVLKDIGTTGTVTVKVVVDMFLSLGDNYTVEDFDKWDAPFVEKAGKVIKAVKDYLQGSKKQKK